MNGRRAIVGLCMLCALLVSAFAAQSASAFFGTTAFTCVKNAKPENRRGEHCLVDSPLPAEYGHVDVQPDETTDVTVTNAKTANSTTEASTARLKTTIAGVPLEFGATGVSGSGWITNAERPNGEHYTHDEDTITFTGVQVIAPAGRGCKAYTDNEAAKTEGEQGVIHTRTLKATTEGQGMAVKLQPKEGTSFANFFVTCEEGKKIPAIEGTWECTGSVKAIPNGATKTFTHATTTAENSLKCRGAKTGIDGSVTLTGKRTTEMEYKPLATTTVVT